MGLARAHFTRRLASLRTTLLALSCLAVCLLSAAKVRADEPVVGKGEAAGEPRMMDEGGDTNPFGYYVSWSGEEDGAYDDDPEYGYGYYTTFFMHVKTASGYPFSPDGYVEESSTVGITCVDPDADFEFGDYWEQDGPGANPYWQLQGSNFNDTWDSSYDFFDYWTVADLYSLEYYSVFASGYQKWNIFDDDNYWNLNTDYVESYWGQVAYRAGIFEN